MGTYSMMLKSCIAGSVSAVWLCGCVINPYVRTGSQPVGSFLSHCSAWKNKTVDVSQAMEYADCTRRIMEDKAGRYAVMNSGGGGVLLNIAGLAAYRGFRGGHEANVAALTTGGAALYGTQQYLYRKPREAIYWSGANAIGCAMGIARKSSLSKSELDSLDVQRTAARIWINAAKAGRDKVISLRPAADTKQCKAEIADIRRELEEKFKAAESVNSTTELEARDHLIGLRTDRIRLGQRNVQSDLITATDAIRDTINRQLAIEQPDPAELAKLVAGLKLSPLEAATKVEPAPDVESKPAKPQESVDDSLRKISSMNYGLPPAECPVSQKQLEDYGHAIKEYATSADTAHRSLQVLESELAALDGNGGDGTQKSDASKLCQIARSGALTPFALQLPQEGAQKVTQGASILIPITGGAAPFSAVPAAPLKSGTLAATPEATDDGGFRFKVTASDTADVGTYAIIANDGVGVTRVFQVEIIQKK